MYVYSTMKSWYVIVIIRVLIRACESLYGWQTDAISSASSMEADESHNPSQLWIRMQFAPELEEPQAFNWFPVVLVLVLVVVNESLSKWRVIWRLENPKPAQPAEVLPGLKPLANKTKAIVDPVFAFVTRARKRLFMLPFEKNQVWSGPEQPLARRGGRTATNKLYQIEIMINQVLKLFFWYSSVRRSPSNQ